MILVRLSAALRATSVAMFGLAHVKAGSGATCSAVDCAAMSMKLAIIGSGRSTGNIPGATSSQRPSRTALTSAILACRADRRVRATSMSAMTFSMEGMSDHRPLAELVKMDHGGLCSVSRRCLAAELSMGLALPDLRPVPGADLEEPQRHHQVARGLLRVQLRGPVAELVDQSPDADRVVRPR